MSKWVKFKDELPPDNWKLWVSDGEDVWPEDSGIDPSEFYENIYWMDRINPAPPENERHCCSVASHEYLFEAYETKDRDEMFLRMACKDKLYYHLAISHCPFCGFTLEEK